MEKSMNHINPNMYNFFFSFDSFINKYIVKKTITIPIIIETLSNKGSVDKLIGINTFPKIISKVGRLLKKGVIPKTLPGMVSMIILFLKIM
jgi:uncharacterized protein YjgD (DUF1641 family)